MCIFEDGITWSCSSKRGGSYLSGMFSTGSFSDRRRGLESWLAGGRRGLTAAPKPFRPKNLRTVVFQLGPGPYVLRVYMSTYIHTLVIVV
jgi:hypothetical protein